MGRRNSAVLLGVILFVVQAFSQPDKFEAIPPEDASSYHIDFSRYFFADPQREKAQRSTLNDLLTNLEKLKGHVAANPENLLAALHLYDDALIQFNKHESYLYLRSSLNTRDEAAGAEDLGLTAQFNKRTAFLQEELTRITNETLTSYIKKIADLAKY